MSRWREFFENSRAFFKVEKWVQIHFGAHPLAYFPLYFLARGASREVVGPKTEIAIEGYPRSANSFAVTAFRRAQGRKVRVANNLHVPAQIARASRLGIPTLVLLRDPRDAVLSLAIRDPISLGQALEYYVSFYEAAEEYSDSYVLGLFEEVVGDYGAVIERVNARFGTEFTPFRHTESDVGEVFTRIERVYERDFLGASSMEEAVSRPSEAREGRKAELVRELESPRYQRLLARADTVYKRLADKARA